MSIIWLIYYHNNKVIDMGHHLHTGILHLNISEVDFEVAHLYEHLLIATFKASLEKCGFSKYLFGWVSGETFRDVMFIEYGFYNPKVEELFLKFLQSMHRYDSTMIDTELLRIQAESKSILRGVDSTVLKNKLEELEGLEFVNHSDEFKPMYLKRRDKNLVSTILPMTRSKKDFRNVIIFFGLRQASLEDMQAFLRLRPLILDAIDEHMFSSGAYTLETTQAFNIHDTDGIAGMIGYSVRRGTITVAQINKNLRSQLEKLRAAIKENPSEVILYFDCFQSTPNWHSFPIDYFRYAGMLTSRKNISSASTHSNLVALLDRLEIHAQSDNPQLRQLLEDNS